jgi:hypothetical protein
VPQQTQSVVEPAKSDMAADDVYTDPERRFSVPIPVNWSVQQADGYAILTAPDGGMGIYVLALAADDLEAAVEQAWGMVDPEFGLEPDQILDEPATDVERAITVTYDPEDEERFALGGGWLNEGIAYIALVQVESGL